MAEQELRDWLAVNRAHFAEGYTSDEVAHLAVLAGFDVADICMVLSHWQDAIQGSKFENRRDFHINREIHAIEARSGKFHLTEQWRALGKKLLLGKDFDD